MKCDICNSKIEMLFLEKINGTYIRIKGKKKVICTNCQKELSQDEIKQKLS